MAEQGSEEAVTQPSETEERPPSSVQPGATTEGEEKPATTNSTPNTDGGAAAVKEETPEETPDEKTVEPDPSKTPESEPAPAPEEKEEEKKNGDTVDTMKGAVDEKEDEVRLEAEESTTVGQESQETESTPKEVRRKEKKKRKKTKTPREDGTRSSPRSRKRGVKSRGGHNRQMEEILVSLFLPYDPDSTGTVDSSTFWQIIQSPELNLQLEPQQLATLQEVVVPDRSGLISYAEFAAQAGDLISSLYQEKPDSEDYHVQMSTPSGHRVLSYDKKTGHFQDMVAEGVDPFEENIRGLYQSADVEGRGFITRDEFIKMFELEQLGLLTGEDHTQMLEYFDQLAPAGQATYEEFYRLGKELILRLYRNQDTTDSEWIELHSEELGRYQLNIFTGEIQRDAAALQVDHAHPQMDLVDHAFQEAQQAAFETEQYKEQSRELQNQLRQMAEEQETLTMQLEQTGHVLDEANAEIREKEEEIERLRIAVGGKDDEIELLKQELSETVTFKEKTMIVENALEAVQEEVKARGKSVEARDSSIANLKKRTMRMVEELKTAWADVEARDSTISKLKHQLTSEQGRTKTYQEQSPLIEAKVSEMEAEIRRLNQLLDEKNSALSTSRKHLKNSRERNLELEKVAEQAVKTENKLKGAESEIKTLKGLLTSKTAMVERRKKELGEKRAQLAELEERDRRRSIVLADVLERTARHCQQTLGMARPGAETSANLDPQFSLNSSHLDMGLAKRPVSAPPDQLPPHPPPASSSHLIPNNSPFRSSQRIVRTYTIPGGSGQIRRGAAAGGGGGGGGGGGSKRGKNRTVGSIPRLPPISRRGLAKSLPATTSFRVPTVNETREMQRHRDKGVVHHSESNPRCTCQLCTAGGATAESMEDGMRLDEQVALAGLTGTRDNSLARQIARGQRVLVEIKRSEFDLEPQRYTGMVKYVGKIDSEFVDNRVYVGVKLDEPVGDTDGLVKGKRYFQCPAGHGKVVRLSNVVAILPRSSVSYRQLPTTSKRSPYNSAPTTNQRRARVKVT